MARMCPVCKHVYKDDHTHTCHPCGLRRVAEYNQRTFKEWKERPPRRKKARKGAGDEQ